MEACPTNEMVDFSGNSAYNFPVIHLTVFCILGKSPKGAKDPRQLEVSFVQGLADDDFTEGY